ncbi:MAG: hypothetical protein DI628_01055 [Blastochloris viridis]|uniref:Uncharacterized protein n=1 Tax=Blastochloris viridis TaxID=1079 RepID=A0A6N4RBX4_BLAVI|nr:MAG: hypothetical protein DI628_01055 [Blastochloris viridis]
MAAKLPASAGLGAKVVHTTVQPEPMSSAERDEIAALVMRIKRADERSRKLELVTDSGRPVVSASDRQWADDWKLPSEVFEYFELEHAA